jgi:outer membrane protein OmpA-like peptidoglycan-associated protein
MGALQADGNTSFDQRNSTRGASMRVRTLVAVAALVPALAGSASAQRPVAWEGGLFGQFTKMDKELSLDDVLSIGARLGVYLLPNIAFELDGQMGKTDWTNAAGVRSITYSPIALRVVWAMPLAERLRLMLGLGYQHNVYRDRTQDINGFIAGNEYEDAVTALVGLKVCLNQKWSLRGDVPIDYNPSPNFNGSLVTLDGESTNIGFRIGLSRMFDGNCYGSSAMPTAPPPVAPPPATPTQTPTPAPVTPIPTPTPTPPQVPANTPPAATITSPGSGSSLTGPVNFAGSCTDPEQGNVTASARWRSSRDGDLGTGASFTRTLSPGAHTITLTCTDGPGLTGTASVTVTSQELLVRLNWVYFDFDRSTLTQAGRDTLDRVIGTLQQRSDLRIAVEGHTDPFGSDTYNQSLSERRAQAVVDYLTRGGVAASRIGQRGFGEQCLILDDDRTRPARSRAEHRANRRVEIWSVGDGGTSSSCRPRQ